jgi:hypothetical protein
MSGTVQAPDTATNRISSGGIQVSPVGIGYYPNEGSRSVSAIYNWTANTAYNEDLSGLQAAGMETTIQSIWVDNTANGAAVTLVVNGTGQRIVVPAYAMGCFPFFVSGAGGFSISSPITTVLSSAEGFDIPYTPVTRVVLLNVPCNTAGVWYAVPPNSPIFSRNIVGNTSLKTGPGFLSTVVVTTVIGPSTVTVTATGGGGGALGGDQIVLVIPANTAVGTIYQVNAPFETALQVTGLTIATGALCLMFS